MQGGRFDMGRLFYMGTLTGAPDTPTNKIFSDRLKVVGKLPKGSLAACMRKLLATLNTMGKANNP